MPKRSESTYQIQPRRRWPKLFAKAFSRNQKRKSMTSRPRRKRWSNASIASQASKGRFNSVVTPRNRIPVWVTRTRGRWKSTRNAPSKERPESRPVSGSRKQQVAIAKTTEHSSPSSRKTCSLATLLQFQCRSNSNSRKSDIGHKISKEMPSG